MPPPDPAATGPARPAHVLSFDVEEYFQVEAAAARVCPEDWANWPCRLDSAVEDILQLLVERDQRATFFVLGWVARRQPHLVRRIGRAGYEIASHGMTHAMLHRLTREQFAAELTDSRALLEDLSGRPVLGYRAPTFSITRATAWALDVLVESGYAYDSSVFPVLHDRYGVPDAPRTLHRAIGPAGGEILEMPPLTMRALGRNMPVGGGGYLRLLPAPLLAAGLRGAERRGAAGMIYLHPWELDPRQPVLPMSRLSRWRHRVNLRRTRDKLDYLCRRFHFGEAQSLLEQTRPKALPTFRYG